MKRFFLFAYLFASGCSSPVILTEEKVRVISSLDACYEISLRNSDKITSIQTETGYKEIVIPDEWKAIYANQRALVRKSPFYCDLWFNNSDFIDEITLILK